MGKNSRQPPINLKMKPGLNKIAEWESRNRFLTKMCYQQMLPINGKGFATPCSYELDTGDWTICRDMYILFPFTATNKNHQGKKSRRYIKSNALCIADWRSDLGCLWHFAGRPSHHHHQFVVADIKYFDDCASD